MRLALEEKERTEYTQRAVSNLASYLKMMPPSYCALYHPIKGEMSPLGICALLPQWQWALPVITEKAMHFYHWQPDGAVTQGEYQIHEPVGTERCFPDIIITPLLAVDRQGYRLGYGKGYYDRYFAAHLQVTRIGVGFCIQHADILPYEAHDIPLHSWVNEKGIITF